MNAGDLAAVPLFSDLSDAERERLAGQMKEVSLPEGAELIEQGDLSFKFFVLLEGSALVEHSGRRLADLGPGDFFGEMGILGKQRRNAEIIAISPVRLAVMVSWDFHSLLDQHPRIRYRVEETANERAEQLGL
ncbi:MAG TPA: cyclic nucleotide-binding domain-containing protein [Acidimicrobiia bacterium]|nr:cyclic nucleotide-binding domain-containing protein [Acidimicrobiia bacterium]